MRSRLMESLSMRERERILSPPLLASRLPPLPLPLSLSLRRRLLFPDCLRCVSARAADQRKTCFVLESSIGERLGRGLNACVAEELPLQPIWPPAFVNKALSPASAWLVIARGVN